MNKFTLAILNNCQRSFMLFSAALCLQTVLLSGAAAQTTAFYCPQAIDDRDDPPGATRDPANEINFLAVNNKLSGCRSPRSLEDSTKSLGADNTVATAAMPIRIINNLANNGTTTYANNIKFRFHENVTAITVNGKGAEDEAEVTAEEGTTLIPVTFTYDSSNYSFDLPVDFAGNRIGGSGAVEGFSVRRVLDTPLQTLATCAASQEITENRFGLNEEGKNGQIRLLEIDLSASPITCISSKLTAANPTAASFNADEAGRIKLHHNFVVDSTTIGKNNVDDIRINYMGTDTGTDIQNLTINGAAVANSYEHDVIDKDSTVEIAAFDPREITTLAFRFNYPGDDGPIYRFSVPVDPSKYRIGSFKIEREPTLLINGGAAQFTIFGRAFPEQLRVLATDINNNPMPGVVVSFAVNDGAASATFAPATATTGPDGIASTTVTAATNTSGSNVIYTVTASADDFADANFTLTGTPAGPTTMEISDGNNQQVAAGENFLPLRVIVTDGVDPVVGEIVTFAEVPNANGASATLTAETTTDNDGIATVMAAANTTIGEYSIRASVVGIDDIEIIMADFTLENIPGVAKSLIITPLGGESTRGAEEDFPELVATVTDAHSNPVGAGVMVNFNVSTGATGATASLSADGFTAINNSITVPTDAMGMGIAKITATAGTVAGSYTVTAAVADVTPLVSATASLNNTGSGATIEKVNSTDLMVVAGDGFATDALAVTVRDSRNNPVGTGIGVVFTVEPSGFAGLKIDESDTAANMVTARTGSNGMATVIATAATTMVGEYKVLAALATDSSTDTEFTVTNIPGAASKIVIAPKARLQSAAIGSEFASLLEVTVTDEYGNAVGRGTEVTFTAPAAVPGTATAGLTTATDSTAAATKIIMTDNNGQASVIATANSTASTAESYTVTATVDGITPIADEHNFLLTNTTAPANITIIGIETDPSAGTQMTTVGTDFNELSVTVTDAANAGVYGAVVTFTAMPAENEAAANLGLAINAEVPAEPVLIAIVSTEESGIANVTAMANTKVGAYTVLASVAVDGVETTFNLSNTAGEVAGIVKTSGDGQSVIIGKQSAPLEVTLADIYDNPVVDGDSEMVVTFALTAAEADAAGATLPEAATIETIGGVAMISVTANETLGGHSVTATLGDDDDTTKTFTLTNIELMMNSSFCFPVMGENSMAVICL